MNHSQKSKNKSSLKFVNSTLDSFVVKDEIVKDINAISNQDDNKGETPTINIVKPDYKLYLELSLDIFSQEITLILERITNVLFLDVKNVVNTLFL